MRMLDFKKDSSYDKQFGTDENYDTYRLYGKDVDNNEFAYEIYVRIPKDESIGNLHLETPDIAHSQIKKPLNKGKPLIFYFDDLKNSFFKVNPNINLTIDPSIKLHLKFLDLDEIAKCKIVNESTILDENRDIYLNSLKLKDVYNSTFFLENGCYGKRKREPRIECINSRGVHLILDDLRSVFVSGVNCYDAKKDFFAEDNRKIKFSPKDEAGIMFISLDIKYESDQKKNQNSIVEISGASIQNSTINFHFKKTNKMSISSNCQINNANIHFEDVTISGDATTLFRVLREDNNSSDEPDFIFKKRIHLVKNFFKDVEGNILYVNFRDSGKYEDISIISSATVVLKNTNSFLSTIINPNEQQLIIEDSYFHASNLNSPTNGGAYFNIFIEKLNLTRTYLKEPLFNYGKDIANHGELTIKNLEPNMDMLMENCRFDIKKGTDQNITLMFTPETAKMPHKLSNLFFEDSVDLKFYGVDVIDNSIFKNTNSEIYNCKGIYRCDFSGQNKLTNISENINDSAFTEAYISNMTDLSTNFIENFKGSGGSYKGYDSVQQKIATNRITSLGDF